jgi:hypothetical protein
VPAATGTPVTTSGQAAPAVETAPSRPTSAGFKDAWLAEVRKGRMVFYSTVVAQAQKIDVTPERITFTFTEGQRTLRDMFEQNRGWLETLAQTVAGKRIPVSSATADVPGSSAKPSETPSAEEKKAALKERALADPGVQALLEVFPADIRDVEEV